MQGNTILPYKVNYIPENEGEVEISGWNHSFIILGVTDDEGEIQLLMNIKYTVIVEYPVLLIQNTPHSMSLILCETIVIYSQYKIEAITEHYF